MKRRDFSLLAGAAMVAGSVRAQGQKPKLPKAKPPTTKPMVNQKPITLILAPTNLGLRPNPDDSEPGTWRAPQVFMNAGLERALGAAEVLSMKRPTYSRAEQPNTRIRNGHAIRAFSLELAEKVRASIEHGRFPVVIGGDCGVLLGGLYGSRLAGGRGLVHIDGHSDFSNPANYDTTKRLGSVAGMDLALASGRGEDLLTTWPNVAKPLVADAEIIQIGERESEDPDWYSDFLSTGITQHLVQRVLKDGIDATVTRVLAKLEAAKLDKVWLHVDLDVLDQVVMPAVDSPGSPGLTYAQLSQLVGALCASGRIVGAEFTIYDPDLDPTLKYARPLVDCIAAGLMAGGAGSRFS